MTAPRHPRTDRRAARTRAALLGAQQIAETGMAPVRGWIAAEEPCDPATLAAAIHRGSAALLAALTEPAG